MSLWEAYLIFGIPMIAIAIAAGALWLTDRSARKVDERRNAAE